MANTYRRLLADVIEKNGGYSRAYSERCALEWTVGVYARLSTFDELYPLALKRLQEDHGITAPNWTAAALQEVARKWDRDMENGTLWNWIVEDMRRGVIEADTYRSVRPEIAARYGLSGSERVMPLRYKRRTDEMAYHPAKKEGWIMVNPYANIERYDVSWEFHGRGGKHLCLTEFEGKSLEHRSDDLAEAIREDDSGEYPNSWCQKLLAFIHECDLCFTSKIVEQEWEYQAAYFLAQNLLEAHEEGDENELGLEELTEPTIVEGTVYVTAKIKGVEDDDEADEQVFALDIDPVRMPERKALLLAAIFKQAVEAHLARHG